jgi:NAD(P)-dependent dehydrogenase (short-subunit alcohol dehydrogenase family)
MFEQSLSVGLYGTLWAMLAVLPAMRARGGGRIINIGSIYGDNVSEYIGDYNAATAAVHGLTRTAAMEWGRHNILVNVLMPTVDSAAFRDYCARHADDIAQPLTLIPLGRFGDAERDIGGAALFLVGPHGSYITGQVVHADGGYHMAGPVYVPRLHE